MFKKDYKEQIESINADGYIKQKVLRQISQHNLPKASKPRIKLWRCVTAVAACVAIVLSVFSIGVSKQPETVTTTYDKVYSAVKKFKPTFLESVTSDIAAFGVKTDEVELYADSEGAAENYNYAASDKTSASDEYSETTSQVEGVSESDIVKTDGKYIYCLSTETGEITVVKSGREPIVVSRIKSKQYKYNYCNSMYLVEDRLVTIAYENGEMAVYIYDVSSPENITELYRCSQSGSYTDSRMIGDKLYLITEYNIDVKNINENKPETYIPSVNSNGCTGVVDAESIRIDNQCETPVYTVICAYDITDGSLCSTQSLLGGTYTVYCSTKNIITAGFDWDGKTPIARYSIEDGKIEFIAEGKIKGSLLNQFSIDEYKGNFRFVTTIYSGIETRQDDIVSYKTEQSNALYVLDSKLNQIGAIENLAPDERVYSVRFMGDIAYFVTFRQTDPLFSADLSNPEKPVIIGELKIPGFSNYLFPFGEGNLLGVGMEADENTGRTTGVKLSMFDISNPANVKEYSKTVLNGYSNGIDNHKSILVDKKKNLISFPTYGKHGYEYVIFSFNGGEFKIEKQLKFSFTCYNSRGMFINDLFYVVTQDSIYIYELDSFEQLEYLEFKD